MNDAIVMIETMNTHRSNGMTVRDAAARGAADRLRPILTTSITTIIGVIPLALSDPTLVPVSECDRLWFSGVYSDCVAGDSLPLFVIDAQCVQFKCINDQITIQYRSDLQTSDVQYPVEKSDT